MKRTITILVCTIAFLNIYQLYASLSFHLIDAKKDNSIETTKYTNLKTETNIVIVEFQVKGMFCGGCEEYVEHQLKKKKGIIEVKASHESEKVTIKYSKKLITIEKVKEALINTKYQIGTHKII